VVDDRPQRPHEVDVTRVLAGLRREEQLAAPDVADQTVALDERRRDRELVADGT
jgi:hypothetical protein